MTRIVKTTIATIFAATLGAAALHTPAHAGGQVSIGINAKNAEQAQAINAGLAIYSIFSEIEGSGITQNGANNIAGLLQNGAGNTGVVHQEGNGHNGTLQQHGHGNSYGLFQFGQGTNAHVNQTGYGQSGVGFTFGW
ncbi:curlin [Pelagibacterium xiamenense]|uniref:curlin n=1 Tax=Pelagibacterium xiamenense TaxID=2901140 RepID=UPI001E3E3341|nr:curlin [Pelagibacterium xiamenense]MCD7059455.1 curlin [Pelagibacterium xiamenense]